MLHTVQIKVPREQVPHTSQPHRCHDLSAFRSESSIHPPPLQQPVVTSPGFSQVGASWAAVVDLTSLPAALPIMLAPQWMRPITYSAGFHLA